MADTYVGPFGYIGLVAVAVVIVDILLFDMSALGRAAAFVMVAALTVEFFLDIARRWRGDRHG